MVHAPPPAQASAAPPWHPRRLCGSLAIAALAAPLAGCGINNIPTRDEAADLAWTEVQTGHAARAALARDLVEVARRAARPGASAPAAGAPAPQVAIDAVRRAALRVAHADVSPGTLSDPVAFARFERRQDELGAALGELARTLEAGVETGTAIETGTGTDAGGASEALARERVAHLLERLEAAQSRVAFARADYNEAVRRYNTELRTVPGRWWHRFMYSTMAPRRRFDDEGGPADPPAGR